MKKMRDPAIKLFGKEIALADTGGAPAVSGEVSAGGVIKTGDEKQGKKKDGLQTDKESQRLDSPPHMEENKTPYDSEDDPTTPPILENNEKPNENENEQNEKSLENENEQNETNYSDKTPLKKPDKILPCPRCNSMDTKFCYYNNYNVNQPRHFCKGCQRYWTAGGTTRNVPVGAGRRKSKNSAPLFRHVTISEPTNATVNFSFETSKNNSFFRNKIFEAEKGSDCLGGNSVIRNSNEGRIGIPWPYPAMYPIPVYPIPYWNYGYPFPIYNPNIPSNSPLGKHSRNGELFNPINADNSNCKELGEPTILIPKTLRIDDPDEAAKSSIWATLGIKNDLINRKGIFKAFEPKGDGKKDYLPEKPESMRANPAAMSRSVNFQETA